MPAATIEQEKTRESESQIDQKLQKELQTTLEALKVLPVVKKATPIQEKLRKHRVLFTPAEPGTGKSYGLPPLALEVVLENNPNAKVMVIESRKKLVEQLGSHSHTEEGKEKLEKDKTLKDRLNEYVDFTNKDHRPSPKTRINFAVENSALNLIKRMIKNPDDPDIKDYDCIIVDEAHRDMGVLKTLLKEAMEKNPRLKVILATGTPDAARKRFYKLFPDMVEEEIKGRKHEIETKWAPRSYSKEEVITEGPLLVEKLISEGKKPIRIVMFMPGEQEITQTQNNLQNILEKLNRTDIEIIRVMAKDADGLKKIDASFGKEKIIIATDALEEGVDPDCDTSIVSCWRKTKIEDPIRGTKSWVTKRFSRPSIMQQMKRAGRKEKGTGYILCTQEDFNNQNLVPLENLEEKDLANDILELKILGYDNIYNFQFEIEKKPQHIQAGIQRLQKLGALDINENVTPIGKEMSSEETEPPYARMMVEAKKRKQTNAVAILIGLMTTDSRIFNREFKWTDELVQKYNPDGKKSDFIALLHIWNDFAQKKELPEGINKYSFIAAENTRKELLNDKRSKSPALDLSKENIQEIEKCILSGLADQTLRSTIEGYRFNDGREGKIQIDNTSIISGKPLSKIVSGALNGNQKTPTIYAQFNQELDQSMLDEVAPYLKDLEQSQDLTQSQKTALEKIPTERSEFEEQQKKETDYDAWFKILEKLKNNPEHQEVIEPQPTANPSTPPEKPRPPKPETLIHKIKTFFSKLTTLLQKLNPFKKKKK